MICTLLKEKFEDTKVVNRRRKSKKNRQHNGQKKQEKRIYRKLKIEQHEPHLIPRVNSCASEGLAVPAPHVTPVVLLFNDMNII